jgi:hypothetical protein
MGRQAVGVEMRGDPFLGVHWNIREDLYHQGCCKVGNKIRRAGIK